MARFTVLLLLFLFATISGRVKGNGCEYLAQITGGCPDPKRCTETCRPCYRGSGYIQPECVAPGGDVHFWECRCYFKNGAPCPPGPGPACPKPPMFSAP